MKLIAFYLPQFHEIAENNEWWGKGFTEWTNTKQAQPLFKGHYQPREPLNNNYYNLLDEGVQKWQIQLAKEYGLYGFCFYHYWFKNGKKLLEKPTEKYLEKEELDFPFCLSWANEPWSRRWDGSEHKILMPQEYGNKSDWKEHFYYLLPFFKDERYIRFNGKPVFIIYKPEIIPCINEMIEFWQELAMTNGIESICFVYQYPTFQINKEKDDSKFEFAIEFEPLFSSARKYKNINFINRIFKYLINVLKKRDMTFNKFKQILNLLMDIMMHENIKFRFNAIKSNEYSDFVDESLSLRPLSNKSIPGVFTDWDNTPRRKENATLFIGSDPRKFKEYLSNQIRRAKEVYKKDMIFINAWNEWAEGAYLEPDKKNGYKYLEAVKAALIENGYDVNSSEDVQNNA